MARPLDEVVDAFRLSLQMLGHASLLFLRIPKKTKSILPRHIGMIISMFFLWVGGGGS